jgi:hypothetical protein
VANLERKQEAQRVWRRHEGSADNPEGFKYNRNRPMPARQRVVINGATNDIDHTEGFEYAVSVSHRVNSTTKIYVASIVSN